MDNWRGRIERGRGGERVWQQNRRHRRTRGERMQIWGGEVMHVRKPRDLSFYNPPFCGFPHSFNCVEIANCHLQRPADVYSLRK